MSDERIIGELKEFKKNTERRIDALERTTEKRIESLEIAMVKALEKVASDIRGLDQWQWKKNGEAGVIASVVSAAVSALSIGISKKIFG